MTDRSHRRYGESGRGDDPAKGANATPAQAVTSLPGPNPTTPQPSTPSPRPRCRLNRLHALRSKWGDCYWKPGDGASAPEWAEDPCEAFEPDLIEFENDVRADFVELLRRAGTDPSPFVYLPMDCPICGRHRMEWNGHILRCEKCTTSSEWDGFTTERYEARITPPALDVEALTRVMWNSVDEARAWLSGEATSHNFASWIAAEYARLSEQPEGEQK